MKKFLLFTVVVLCGLIWRELRKVKASNNFQWFAPVAIRDVPPELGKRLKAKRY